MKQTAVLFVIPCIWGFHIAYDGSTVMWNELGAMLAILIGTLWFISADRTQSIIAQSQIRLNSQYAEATDDEEELLMSWKEAEGVVDDTPLRLSKKDDKVIEQRSDVIIESQRQEPITTIETDYLTPTK